MTFKIGTVVLKTAGRDSGKIGVIIDLVKDNYVIVDGYVRRKKCNVKHLEPLDEIKIKKNETSENVKNALIVAGYKEKERKIFSKKPGRKERPKKVRKVKTKKIKDKKEIKKEEKQKKKDEKAEKKVKKVEKKTKEIKKKDGKK